jgi:hypothetical protein
MFGLTLVLLLPPSGEPYVLGLIADPDPVPEAFQHLLKPRGVDAGFQSDDDLAGKLLVEATHIILLVMQLSAVNFAVRCAAITYRLTARMKINALIYCHPPPPATIPNRCESNKDSQQELTASYHQNY